MVFEAWFERKAQAEAYGQDMEKLRQTRDGFLKILVENGVESTHGLGEVIFGDDAGNTRGRKTTTVKLAAVGEWAEENDIQVEIFAIVSKDKLRQLGQANKKPTVYARLTFPDEVRAYFVPNNVTNSHAYIEDRLGDRSPQNKTLCVGLAEVMEYFQAGKLAVVRE